jgi:hypothetical protein
LLTSGYALQLETTDGKNATARLLRQGRTVTTAEAIPLASDQPLSVNVERRGQQLLIAIADKPLWRFLDRAPLTGRRVGYQAQGWRVDVGDAEVKTRQVYDYTFYRAPADWHVTAGTWEVASRWTCSPGWSWFGGWSRDLAAVWNKREFVGDVVVQMFVAPRMDPQDNYQRVGNLCITLCGDGNDVHSGYNFVFAGNRNKVTALFRGKQVVHETTDVLLPTPFHNGGHRRWFNVTAEKIGNVVSLYVDNQLALRYTDPQPLAGRRIALWTRDSGMMVARATIYYERETLGETAKRRNGESAHQRISETANQRIDESANTQDARRKTQDVTRAVPLPPPVAAAPPVVYSRGLHQLKATYFQDEDQGAFQNSQLNKPIFWNTFLKPVSTRAEDKIEFNWGAGKPPLPNLRATYWSVQFNGKLYVSEEGAYTFFLDKLDDGARLTIDGKVIFDSWNVQSANSHKSEAIRLTAGFHTLRLNYCQGDREASVVLAWSSDKLSKEVIPKGESRAVTAK